MDNNSNNNLNQTKSDEEISVRIRVTENPLTAHNVATVIGALTEMHTKFWLVQQGRFAELIEYHENPGTNPIPEVKLVIGNLTYHSPLELQLIGFVTDPIVLGAALRIILKVFKIAVETISQAPGKNKEAKLKSQLLEQDLKLKEQQVQLREVNAGQKQELAELEKEKLELEIERQRLLLQIDVQKARLELEKERVDFALDLADKVVQRLYPDADAATRSMVSRTLLPEFLQLGQANGLELALPAPSDNPEVVASNQEI